MAVLIPRRNPLFRPRYEEQIRIAISDIVARAAVTTEERQRIIRRMIGTQTAKEAIAGLAPGRGVFGLTVGQFSLVDLLYATIDHLGPCQIDLSTWSAATTDVADMVALIADGRVQSMRMILDLSLVHRKPEVAKTITERFGRHAIRVTSNHAKFALLSNDRWQVVLKTSMNLNQNPRMEDFDLSTDPELFAFLKGFVDRLFTTEPREYGTAGAAKAAFLRLIERWNREDQEVPA